MIINHLFLSTKSCENLWNWCRFEIHLKKCKLLVLKLTTSVPEDYDLPKCQKGAIIFKILRIKNNLTSNIISEIQKGCDLKKYDSKHFNDSLILHPDMKWAATRLEVWSWLCGVKIQVLNSFRLFSFNNFRFKKNLVLSHFL